MEDFINGSDDLYDKVFSVRDVMDVIESLGLEISFWESLCIVTHIKEVMRNDDDQDQYSNLVETQMIGIVKSVFYLWNTGLITEISKSFLQF